MSMCVGIHDRKRPGGYTSQFMEDDEVQKMVEDNDPEDPRSLVFFQIFKFGIDPDGKGENFADSERLMTT